MKICSYAILIFLMFTAAPTFATVTVTKPTSGETVGSPVAFEATATSTCSDGVGSMGVYVNNVLKYVGTGNSLNTNVGLTPGTYNAVIEEWDNCGGATTASREIKVTSDTGVFVTSPINNSTVSSPTSFVATSSTSTCPQGVASMGVYVDGVRDYVVNGAKLNTQLPLAAGTHSTVVQEWDHCGRSTTASLKITVQSTGKTFSNLQASKDWVSWGQVGPKYIDCSPSPCDDIQFSHTLGISSPALSGNATKFTLGGPDGKARYGDALFTLALIGVGSTQSLPDSDHKLLPTLHNFTYDTEFYVTNAAITQALEFDISQWVSESVGMTFGTQCNHLGDGDWDIWNNQAQKWTSAGVPCKFVNGWNHLTIKVQRESNNYTLYESIALNGTTYTLNKSYPNIGSHSGWYGLNVNFQFDGDSKENPNTAYLDQFSLTYW